MNANKGQSETTLDCEVTEQTETENDLTLEAELASFQWTKESLHSYLSKLRLLTRIHKQIAPKLNACRQATYEAFFRPEDKYFPETGESLAQLMLESLKRAKE